MRRETTIGILAVLVLALIGLAASADERRYDGRPEFRAGWERGYYVWREGESWKVRWTTLGAKRSFTGKVVAVGGDLVGLKRIDVEAGRKVVRPGKPARVVRRPGRPPRRVPGKPAVVVTKTEDRIWRDDDHTIRFQTLTDDDVDGFNFRVTEGTERLRFLLKIDGESRAIDVELGRKNQHPANNPFVLDLE